MDVVLSVESLSLFQAMRALFRIPINARYCNELLFLEQ